VIAALVAALPIDQLRYRRPLTPSGPGVVTLVPDGAMYGHAQADFSDLRVVDAAGAQVPWRRAPEPQSAPRSLRVLDSGRRGGDAVALVDRGGHSVIDRVTLEIPDRRFIGSVVVAGSDDRTTWTTLSRTQIYSVDGAAAARSTTALLPPTDLRYLELRASGVSRIVGASVSSTVQPRLVRVPAHVTAGASVIRVDLVHRVPVDELRITSTTPRYDRSFTVTAGGSLVAAGRLRGPTSVALASRARILRIHVVNGDDPPLQGLRVEVLARPRTLLLAAGHPGPFVVYYGGSVRPPVYDFARLPAPEPVGRAVLGPEQANRSFHVVDTRGFFARHTSLVTAALALAAAAILASGALALRRT